MLLARLSFIIASSIQLNLKVLIGKQLHFRGFCYFHLILDWANSVLYNKFLCKHVTAQYRLYLGNVENLVNHFRNAPVGGHTCLTAGEQGEPAD